MAVSVYVVISPRQVPGVNSFRRDSRVRRAGTGRCPARVSTAQLWSQLGKAAGYDVVAVKAVPMGTTNFSNVIQAGRSGNAQVLVASMVPTDCFSMWKQMKALNYQPKIAIGLQCAQTPGWSSLGSLGNGTLVQMNWTQTAGLPDTAEIVGKYSSKYPNANDLGSVALGYAEASVLLNAISRAGSATPSAINKALASTQLSTALGSVKFTGNKSVTPTFLGQWENGAVSQVWPAKGAVPLSPLSGGVRLSSEEPARAVRGGRDKRLRDQSAGGICHRLCPHGRAVRRDAPAAHPVPGG
jgi:hypothetical protein